MQTNKTFDFNLTFFDFDREALTAVSSLRLPTATFTAVSSLRLPTAALTAVSTDLDSF